MIQSKPSLSAIRARFLPGATRYPVAKTSFCLADARRAVTAFLVWLMFSQWWTIPALAAERPIARGATTQPQQYSLPNGLRIVLLEDHSFPLLTCQVWYRVGARNESPGSTGLSHIVEHLLFQTVGHFRKGELGATVVRSGGQFNGFTSDDFTSFFENLPASRLDLALKIESERMRGAAFTQADLNEEVARVKAELDENSKDQSVILSREVRSTAFVQHPYRNPVVGWRNDLNSITLKEAREFYDRYFHPNNATLVLVGDFKTAAALTQVGKYFGNIPKSPNTIPIVKINEEHQLAERRVMLHGAGKKDEVQVAYHAPAFSDPDATAMFVLEKLLNAAISGRLRSKLTDQKVCGSARSAFEIKKDPGLFVVTLTAPAGAGPQKMLDGWDSLITQLRSTPVSEQEVSRARAQAEFAVVSDRDGPYRLGFHLGYCDAMQSWLAGWTAVEKIHQVTSNDLLRVCKKYLGAENRVVGFASSPGKPQPPQQGPSPSQSRPSTGTAKPQANTACLPVEYKPACAYGNNIVYAYKKADTAIVIASEPDSGAQSRLLPDAEPDVSKPASPLSAGSKGAAEMPLSGEKYSDAQSADQTCLPSGRRGSGAGSDRVSGHTVSDTKGSSSRRADDSSGSNQSVTSPQAKSQAKSESKSKNKPEVSAEAKSESKSKPEVSAEVRFENKSPVNSEASSDSKSEASSAVNADSESNNAANNAAKDRAASSGGAAMSESETAGSQAGGSSQPASAKSPPLSVNIPSTSGLEPTSAKREIESKQNNDPRGTAATALPSVHRKILKNGMTVLIIESHLDPIVQIVGEIQAGAVFEPSDKKGIAGVLVQLLNDGPAKTNRHDLAQQQEDLGLIPSAMLRFDEGTEAISFQTRCLSRDFGKQLNLIAGSLKGVSSDDGDIEKAKNDFFAYLKASEEQAKTKVNRVLLRSVVAPSSSYYPADPGERAKDASAIKAIDLKEFETQHMRPETTTIVIAGDVNPETAFTQMEKAFDGWASGGKEPAKLPNAVANPRVVLKANIAVPNERGKALLTIGKLMKTQSEVKDFASLLIADCALTNHPIFSRLAQRLTSDPTLAGGLSPEDIDSRFLALSDVMTWSLSMPVDSRQVAKTSAAIQTELKRFARAGITAEELAEVKRFLTNALPLRTIPSTADGARRVLAEYRLQKPEVDIPGQLINRIRAADLTTVNNFIKNEFKPDQSVLIVAGETGEAAHRKPPTD